MTLAELEQRLAYWQKRLRLQDWKVNLRYVHPNEIADNLGRSHVHVDHKSVRVKIIDPALRNPVDDEACVQDPESVLVHELLHLHFSGFDSVFYDKKEEDAKYRDEREHCEQAIELIAQALVAENRSSPRAA